MAKQCTVFRKLAPWLAGVGLVGILLAGGARAQVDGPTVPGLDPNLPSTPPPSPEAEIAAEPVTLLRLVAAGGWAMWPLGAFSVAVLAMALYNLSVLRAGEFCPPELVETLHAHMRRFELRQALDAAGDDDSYLGRMIHRSFPSLDPQDTHTLGREQVQEAMGDFALRANGRYMLWVNYFSILAQASPMLGLLGTVSGMIKAFSVMGRDGLGDPSLLAGHISEALVTTATGLIIALPALFCYFVFRNRLTQLIGRCVDTADALLDDALAAANPDRHGRLPTGLPSSRP